MPYISDNSYLAIKPEAVAGTPLIPNVFVPLISSNIKTVVNHNADKRMKGVDWGATDILRGNRSHEGEVVVLADPDTLGHFLNMVFLKGTTTGDVANGYTHPFTVGTPKTYTLDIKKGVYTQRYFGVNVEQLKLEFADGQMQLTVTIKAMGQFSVSSVGVALTGVGMTSLVLDDEYDISPNRGLVAGDIITVGGVDLTLLTVNANGTTVTFASTTVTASVGASVTLKPQSSTIASLQDPFYLGNVLVGLGVDETASTTASGARSTATAVYDLVMTFTNTLFAMNGSNRLDPVTITAKTKESMIELKQLFENASQRQKFYDRTKQAITVSCLGKFIKTDFTTQEKATFKFFNVKMLEHDNPIEVGEMIVDQQSFQSLYDAPSAKAVTVDLVNRSAGTVY